MITDAVEASLIPSPRNRNSGSKHVPLHTFRERRKETRSSERDVSLSPGRAGRVTKSPLGVNTHRKPSLTVEPENRGQKNRRTRLPYRI